MRRTCVNAGMGATIIGDDDEHGGGDSGEGGVGGGNGERANDEGRPNPYGQEYLPRKNVV